MTRHWFTSYLTENYSRNKKIGLDIGCGKQPYKELYNCQYVGIDLPSKVESTAKPILFGSGESLPFKDDTFDFITSYSVIPYVENIDKFLDEMFRVIKYNGIAIIIIMNLRALSRDPSGYYPNKFSSKQLKNKLKKHGFDSIKSKNFKALFWSTYFNSTSVYSFAIVKCNKNTNSLYMSEKNPNKNSNFTTRQLLRSHVMNHTKFYSFTRTLFRKYCIATQNLHTLPDFLIIGAAKCGTSSLYDYLMQHPCVGKSLTKQIHFFDRYFDRGAPWYKVCFPYKWKKFQIEKIKNKKFATGEATAHYMTHPLAAKRAHQLVPDAKIIVMLRNPVDRAYSHYQMEHQRNIDPLSFEDAIENEPNRIKGEIQEMFHNKNNSGKNYPHKAYIKSGEYLEQIKRWREFYPKEKFLFIKSEEFNKNPSRVYNDVLEFLELTPFKLQKYEKIQKRQYDKMNPDTRQKLIEYFLPHNKNLYDYLEMDFDWDK